MQENDVAWLAYSGNASGGRAWIEKVKLVRRTASTWTYTKPGTMFPHLEYKCFDGNASARLSPTRPEAVEWITARLEHLVACAEEVLRDRRAKLALWRSDGLH